MASKKCPNCSSDCPVASGSCKKCLHVFKSRKGSSNSFSSSGSGGQPASVQNLHEDAGTAGGNSSEGQGRRHTGRITRSKPNFYDSLHVEEQMRQDTSSNLKSGLRMDITGIKRVFVTVGTTSFEDLVNRIQEEDVLKVFRNLGVAKLQIQMGDSATKEGRRTDGDLEVEFFRYKNNIKTEIEQADLVVSHAGAGTVLDVLGQGKRLVVVPNDALMDNHQDELADYLAEKKYAFKGTVKSLPEVLASVARAEPRLPLPPIDPSAFDNFLKTQMKLNPDDVRALESGNFKGRRVASIAWQKLLLRKQLKQSKSEDDGGSGVAEDAAATKEVIKTGEPEAKKRRRGRPPAIGVKPPSNTGRITIHNNRNPAKLTNSTGDETGENLANMKDEDIMSDITPEKALQYNIVLDEINRKWVSASWKVS